MSAHDKDIGRLMSFLENYHGSSSSYSMDKVILPHSGHFSGVFASDDSLPRYAIRVRGGTEQVSSFMRSDSLLNKW